MNSLEVQTIYALRLDFLTNWMIEKNLIKSNFFDYDFNIMFFIKDILLKKLKASRVNNKIVVEILESMKILPLLDFESHVEHMNARNEVKP